MKDATSKIEEIENKIADQQKKLAQLKAQKSKMEMAKRAQLVKAARTEETRRKILLGAYLTERMQHDSALEESIKNGLGSWLTREDDRRVFGLGPLSVKREEVFPETAPVY